MISSNESLNKLNGLNELNSVGGMLTFDSNSSLEILTGLENLQNVGSSFTVYNNASLQELSSLELLSTIGYNLYIEQNPSLLNINSLSGVTSIGNWLYISENYLLTSLSGLENIESNSIMELFIFENPSLSNCDAYSICEYITNPNGFIEIYNNAPGCNNPQEVEAACEITDVNVAHSENNIQVFPNPANNSIIIQTSFEIKEVVIYSQTGQTVLIEKSLKENINISKLPSGLFFILVKTDQGNFREKLIIQ